MCAYALCVSTMIYSIHVNRLLHMDSFKTNLQVCNEAGTSSLVDDRYEISTFVHRLYYSVIMVFDIVLLSAPLHRQVQQVILSNRLPQFQSKCKNLVLFMDFLH